MKHLSEMSYRPKDVTAQALAEYLSGDLWAALTLFEEAADLGVRAAQENAAFLLEKLAPLECTKYDSYVLFQEDMLEFEVVEVVDEEEGKEEEEEGGGGEEEGGEDQRPPPTRRRISTGVLIPDDEEPSSAAAGTPSADSTGAGTAGSLLPHKHAGSSSSSSRHRRCYSPEECCRLFLSRLASRRWVQLAAAGEPRALRKVADALLDPHQPLLQQPPSTNLHSALHSSSSSFSTSLAAQEVAPRGEIDGAMKISGSDGSADFYSVQQQPQQQQRQIQVQRQAAQLYALSGAQGDSESLMQLGWMLYQGTAGGRALLLLFVYLFVCMYVCLYVCF
jgi:TPR repeat protein